MGHVLPDRIFGRDRLAPPRLRRPAGDRLFQLTTLRLKPANHRNYRVVNVIPGYRTIAAS